MRQFRTLLIATAFLVLPTLPAVAGPKDVPLPGDITIVTPGSDVPKELAAFSGKWYGEWHGERTGAYMGAYVIVAERVTKTEVSIVYSWKQDPRWRGTQWYMPDWMGRPVAKFVDGELVLMFTADSTLSCRVADSKTLSCAFRNPRGGALTTFTKVPD